MKEQERSALSKRQTKIEQEDFYIDNGLLVFTEQYHKKRGYCCKNGCRHCPYKPFPTLSAEKL